MKRNLSYFLVLMVVTKLSHRVVTERECLLQFEWTGVSQGCCHVLLLQLKPVLQMRLRKTFIRNPHPFCFQHLI